MRAASALVLVALLLAGCSSTASPGPGPGSPRSEPTVAAAPAPSAPTTPAPSSTPEPTPAPTVAAFPTTGTADYQLGGSYAPPKGVTIVARDSSEQPAPGVFSICYVNGFQSQPQDRSTWLHDRADLVLTRNGTPVIDPNWPDELILDTSTPARREAILTIQRSTIEECAHKGFAAIEFDNLDSYTRSDGAMTAADNAAMAKLFVGASHALGLSVAQKNTAEQARAWKAAVGFDFAVAEECVRYQECASYTSVYGDRVIDIEYTDDLRGSAASTCADPSRPRMTIIRDRDLVTPSSSDYSYRACSS